MLKYLLVMTVTSFPFSMAEPTAPVVSPPPAFPMFADEEVAALSNPFEAPATVEVAAPAIPANADTSIPPDQDGNWVLREAPAGDEYCEACETMAPASTMTTTTTTTTTATSEGGLVSAQPVRNAGRRIGNAFRNARQRAQSRRANRGRLFGGGRLLGGC